MSQEKVEASNRELLRRNFAATQGLDVAPLIRGMLAGDASAVSPQLITAFAEYFDLHHADAEIDMRGVDMPGFGVLRGLEGYRELWTRWIEGWDSYGWTHSHWSEIGEHVIADVQIKATGRSSGADVIWTHCQVWTFRGGKVIRWSLFKDRAEALNVIGLEE
jgi:hypothetical protein